MLVNKKQYLTSSAVRSMCIKENFFTNGSNEMYSYMLSTVDNLPKDEEIPVQSLYYIADFISMYSESEKWIRSTGLTLKDFKEHILYCLYEKVVTTFEIIE